jgi:adenylosuccinate synthase
MIPSGIMHPGKVCVIGNGVVLDPAAFLEEIDELKTKGIEVKDRVFVSQHTHVVMPYHMALEAADEESLGAAAIGTTGRGIGQAYGDKVGRSFGFRVMDLLDADSFRQRLQAAVESKNLILTQIYKRAPLDAAAIIETYLSYAERIRPYVADTSVLLNEALDQGRQVLFEGAQGTLLDIDHGTYPFVTSSNTTAGGACTGTGVGPTRIDEVVGVTKAYTTRVGNGPFPTELTDATGERIREVGHEYGATTGRTRRCGWFDATILRLSKRVNDLTSIALTRLDVLDSFESLKICTAYQHNGNLIKEFPVDPNILEGCEPIYEEIEGWNESTTGARILDQLPAKARQYVERIAALGNTSVSLVSVGPERDATIVV